MYDSSEWVDELLLLVSKGQSLAVQVGSADNSSVGGARGRGGGGGGGGGGIVAGGDGWKPLHFRLPLDIGAGGSITLSISTLSKDFVLQRFFCRKNMRRVELLEIFRDSRVTSNNHYTLCWIPTDQRGVGIKNGMMELWIWKKQTFKAPYLCKVFIIDPYSVSYTP